MAGGLSKRSLRLRVDADHDFPTSVHRVLSNDDLLMEILLRLPIHSLNHFKPVCKQWLSLITSPSFTLTRTRIPVDPPCGLFIRQWSHDSKKYNYDFVSFDPRTPVKRSIEPLVRITRIEQSRNGLLLCYIGDNMYVCNPSTSMFKMLPPKHDLNNDSNGFEEIFIAFDPTKSPCYKVVHCGSVEVDDYDDDDDEVIRIQTYSSETGFWSVSDDRFPYEWFDDFSNGIYWNGAIQWLHYNSVIKLDIVDHPVLTKMQTTLPLTVRGKVHRDCKLFKSHGSFLLLCMDYDHSRDLNIYEMKNEYSVWLVKYSVNLDDMMRPYPTWRMPTKWCCRDMMSIVLGDRDEDSFMVIEVSGNILQYNFGLQTLSGLFYMGKPVIRRSLCFEYIASFAQP